MTDPRRLLEGHPQGAFIDDPVARLLRAKDSFKPLDGAAASRVKHAVLQHVAPPVGMAHGVSPARQFASRLGQHQFSTSQLVATTLGAGAIGGLLALTLGAHLKQDTSTWNLGRVHLSFTTPSEDDSASRKTTAAGAQSNELSARGLDTREANARLLGGTQRSNGRHTTAPGAEAHPAASALDRTPRWNAFAALTPSDPWNALLWDQLRLTSSPGLSPFCSPSCGLTRSCEPDVAPAEQSALVDLVGNCVSNSACLKDSLLLVRERCVFEAPSAGTEINGAPARGVTAGDEFTGIAPADISSNHATHRALADDNAGNIVDLDDLATDPGDSLATDRSDSVADHADSVADRSNSVADHGDSRGRSARKRESDRALRRTRVVSARSAGDPRGLREETVLLEAARSDLARNPKSALATAQEHQTQFPHGQLGSQRTLIQVEALLRLGQDQQAATLTRTLPNALFRARAEDLLKRYGASDPLKD